MGNANVSSKGSGWVRIMKLNGEIIKHKAPLSVEKVLHDYPNHVIIPSEAVTHLGMRTKPLDELMQLSPKHLYFLFEMPKFEDAGAPNRVRSEIHMSAKSRLEAMILAHRSSSDISAVTSFQHGARASASFFGEEERTVRLKLRLSKAQLAQLASESQNMSETAEKILDFFLNDAQAQKSVPSTQLLTENSGLGTYAGTCNKTLRNRVRFGSHVESAEAF
uniref:Uncharacterized protein n=1 Tax=Araucaria cunninghamii TaxID=56994 RepID=A0A0D6R4R9_ARACU